MENFYLWWSIISSVLALGFLCWDIWQFASARKNEELQLKDNQLHKSQVKIWQHFASGISNNLLLISEALRTNKLDSMKQQELSEVIKGIQSSAYALFTSLNEERLFTDEEIKQRQLENEQRLKDLLNPSVSPSSSKPKS